MTELLDTVDQELDRLISRRASQGRRSDPDRGVWTSSAGDEFAYDGQRLRDAA